MNIWFTSYQLYPKNPVNSKDKVKFRKGALLRVRFENGSVGYADLCPFAEMGDRPLEHELRALTKRKPESLGERALYFAKIDAAARAEGKSLFNPQVKIKNHFLVANITSFDTSRIVKLEDSGFTEFKIKLGRDVQAETEALKKFCLSLSSSAKVRLDFNTSMSRERFSDWFDKNQSWVRPCLEFIEDPFAYLASDWEQVSKRFNIRFALDQAADPVATEAVGADVVVVKPAKQDHIAVVEALKTKNKKFVLTHYLDFPVGQMSAFMSVQAIAHQLGEKLLTCGLQHHDIYEGFTFQDAIKNDGPYIIPPAGTGFGFDSLLAKMDWQEMG